MGEMGEKDKNKIQMLKFSMCQKLIQMTKMEKCLNKQKAYGKYNSNNDKKTS